MEKYTLIRKKRKTLTLKLDKDGNATVLAPLNCPQKQIDKFVLGQQSWLRKKREELAKRVPMPVLKFEKGEKIPILGLEFTLVLTEQKSVRVKNGNIYLPKSNPKRALVNHYRKTLREITTVAVNRYAQILNVQYTRITIGSATTRWGACSGKNALTFSYRLAMCNPAAIDYVVAHEVCHIIHKNHSKNFWGLVEQCYPFYKEQKAYLKEKSFFMEII